MSEELSIGQDRVVHFHYTVRDDTDEILETTEGGQPQAILYGHGSVLKGIEEALDGHVSGDQVSLKLAPEEAYGERRRTGRSGCRRNTCPRAGGCSLA